jgi:hypothetical protein
MTEPAAMGSPMPRAFLRIGGMTLARQQLGLALALHCDRIVCIAQTMLPELIKLQHVAEKSGVQFHIVSGPRALIGLVTVADEVIVLGDGLFASVTEATAALEKGQAVLVQPIEQGIAAGFERIDLNHASAGAMRIPGRLVERLGELPTDCDAASALQRIALQAGVSQRNIPASNSGSAFWTLVRSEDEAHALEPQWIRQRTQDEGMPSPGRGLALIAVRAFGPTLLHAGNGAGMVGVAALVLAIMGLGSAWFGLFPFGLGLCGLGWILVEAAALLARIEGDSLERRSDGFTRQKLYGWLLDGVIVILAGWASGPLAGQQIHERMFPPLMLIALLRLVPRAIGGRRTSWLKDRALLCVILAGATIAGVGSEAIYLGALTLAIAGILIPREELRITRP